MGNLFMELFWNAVCFCRFQWLSVVGTLSEESGMELEKTLTIGIPMFAVGYAVTFLGFRHITALPEYTDEMLELFFTYCSLNVVMMTIPVFMLAKKVKVNSERMKKALANLTVCGFGIYMIHYFFTGPSVVLMRAIDMPIGLQIPVAAILAFAVSWGLVWLIYRAGKVAKYIVG